MKAKSQRADNLFQETVHILPKDTSMGTSFPKPPLIKNNTFQQARTYYEKKPKIETPQQLNINGKGENFTVITDNITRNILLYLPTQNNKEKFRKPTVSKEIREIEKQIVRVQNIINNGGREPEQDQQNFEFITDVVRKQEPEEEKYEEKVVQKKDGMVKIQKKFTKLYDKYQDKISKVFLEKEKQIRNNNPKKPPGLKITSKNQMKAESDPINNIGHLMKIYNKEHNPSNIDILVPSFNNKKDAIASTVVSYLRDYRPLIQGNKQQIPKQLQSLLEIEIDMLKQIQINKQQIPQGQNIDLQSEIK